MTEEGGRQKTEWDELMKINAPETEEQFLDGLRAWRDGLQLMDGDHEGVIDVIDQTIDLWGHLGG